MNFQREKGILKYIDERGERFVERKEFSVTEWAKKNIFGLEKSSDSKKMRRRQGASFSKGGRQSSQAGRRGKHSTGEILSPQKKGNQGRGDHPENKTTLEINTEGRKEAFQHERGGIRCRKKIRKEEKTITPENPEGEAWLAIHGGGKAHRSLNYSAGEPSISSKGGKEEGKGWLSFLSRESCRLEGAWGDW